MAEAVPYGRVTQRPSPVPEIHILWMTAGLGCDGDSVSITAATQPSIEDVVLRPFPACRKFMCTIRCSPTKTATIF